MACSASLLRSFSERHGYAPKKEIQVDSMDENLKRRISDVIYEHFELLPIKAIWTRWIGLPVANLEEWSVSPKSILMGKINDTQAHHEIYSLVELIVQESRGESLHPKSGTLVNPKLTFVADMNEVLAENMSAWRIEGDMVVRTVGDAEMGAIREASSLSEENAGYAKDAMKAMGINNPDYKASIAHSTNIAENTLNAMGGKGSGVNQKLDSVAGRLGITDEVVASLKQMNNFSNRYARHPNKTSDYAPNRDDAMLALVFFSAMSAYLHGRWRDRGGKPAR